MEGRYYILESSGPTRQMWGPYASVVAAQHAAGKRHVVVDGSGLRNGLVLTESQVQTRMDTMSIVRCDPVEVS